MDRGAAYHEELMTRIETIEGQRNRALTDHAMVAGKLKVAEMRLHLAEKELQELRPKPAPPAETDKKEP